MECLGIPIDHRLRRVIRETRHMDRDQENSEHLQLLRRFGSSLEIDNSDYPIFDLSFGLEMARPELKGGVLIVLQRPHSTRKNSDGFMQGKNECQSTAAVSELIRTVNNAKLGFDDVSVFDVIPFLNETAREKDHQDIVDEAQDVFADMVRAKDPDVILCCSTTETRNFLVKKLQSQGIGRSFYPDNPRLTEFGLSCILVNAFHPSYAVNFYPICCCFKRLLVLEFTKAFALCRQSWTEEPWMGDLRDECQIRAERKADGKRTRHKMRSHFSNSIIQKRISVENGIIRTSKSNGKNFLNHWMKSLKNVSSQWLLTLNLGIYSTSL